MMMSIVYEATRPPADKFVEEFCVVEASDDIFIPKCSKITETSGRYRAVLGRVSEK